MEKTAFLRLLEQKLDLEAGSLRGDEELETFATWDSLGVLSFMALADRACHVTLSGDAVARCRTLPELIGLLGGAVTEPAGGA